jgi:hypothetical protein
MRKAWFFVIFGLVAFPQMASAVDSARFTLKTTEDLYQVCSTPNDDPLRAQAINFCEGFLLGVVAYHDAITDRQHLKPLICHPDTATRDQGIAAFVAWAGGHQADQKYMNDPPVLGAVRGLASVWPCK